MSSHSCAPIIYYHVFAVESRGPLEEKEEWPALEEVYENDRMQGDKRVPLSLDGSENAYYTRKIDGEESNHEVDFDTPTTVSTSEVLHSPDFQGHQNEALVPSAISDNVRRALLSDVDGEGDNIRKNQCPQPNEDTHSFQQALPPSSELSSKRHQVISKENDGHDFRLGAIDFGVLHC